MFKLKHAQAELIRNNEDGVAKVQLVIDNTQLLNALKVPAVFYWRVNEQKVPVDTLLQNGDVLQFYPGTDPVDANQQPGRAPTPTVGTNNLTTDITTLNLRLEGLRGSRVVLINERDVIEDKIKQIDNLLTTTLKDRDAIQLKLDNAKKNADIEKEVAAAVDAARLKVLRKHGLA